MNDPLIFAPVRCWYAARRFLDVTDDPPTLYTLVVRDWILVGDSGGVAVVAENGVGYCPDDAKLWLLSNDPTLLPLLKLLLLLLPPPVSNDELPVPLILDLIRRRAAALPGVAMPPPPPTPPCCCCCCCFLVCCGGVLIPALLLLLALPVEENDDDGCLLCKYWGLPGEPPLLGLLLFLLGDLTVDTGGDDDDDDECGAAAAEAAMKSMSNADDPKLVVSHVSAVDADGSLLNTDPPNPADPNGSKIPAAPGPTPLPPAAAAPAVGENDNACDGGVGSSAYARFASCFACSRRCLLLVLLFLPVAGPAGGNDNGPPTPLLPPPPVPL